VYHQVPDAIIAKVNYALLLESCEKRKPPEVEFVCANIGNSITHDKYSRNHYWNSQNEMLRVKVREECFNKVYYI